MAKKKVTDTHKEPKKEAQDFVRSQDDSQPAVDHNDSAKLEALRSLNKRLLNEEITRRQKMESLINTNASLEQELTLAKVQYEGVESELSLKILGFDVGEMVFSVYITAQIGQQLEIIESRMRILESEAHELKSLHEEKENEILTLSQKLNEIEVSLRNEIDVSSAVVAERDAVKVTLNSMTEEVEILKENLYELEVKNSEFFQTIERVRLAYDHAMRSNEEGETRIASLTRERDSLKESLMEASNLIEEMKEEISNAVVEKRRMEEMKDVEIRRRRDSENLVAKLNETVEKLVKKEEDLLSEVAEMKKKCIENGVKLKEMEWEIDELTKEKNTAEDRVEKLSECKFAIEKDLGKVLEELAEEKNKVEKLVLEKSTLVESSVKVSSKINELRSREVELNAIVSALEKSSEIDGERIKSLEYEIDEYKSKFDELKFERNDLETRLTEEKWIVCELKKKIGDLVDEVEQRVQAIKEAESAKGAIFAEKEELKLQLETLKMRLSSLENKMSVTQNESESMKFKVESGDARNDMILNMLKKTSYFCQKKGGLDGDFEINGEEIKPFTIEMQRIIDIFRNEETKTENMERKVKSLEKCVDEAQKKKSLWAILSSATSILAACSLAYAAKRT